MLLLAPPQLLDLSLALFLNIRQDLLSFLLSQLFKARGLRPLKFAVLPGTSIMLFILYRTYWLRFRRGR